ncbi:hypothetical protein JCM30204_49730 [Dysgonomonas termitidis]
MGTWSDTGIEIPFGRTSGKVKTLCPKCREGSRRHKLDKSLSVNLDEGLHYIPAKDRKCNTLQFPYLLNIPYLAKAYGTGRSKKGWSYKEAKDILK